MSGHSKWSTIKNRKGAQDAKRGKIFSQLSKQIRIAVKDGGGDNPNSNAALRLALDKAKAANMPKDNISRAIDRGMGRGSQGRIAEVNYEGFGPGGVGMIIVAQTDNTQRTSAEVRNLLSKAGGSLGGPNSVSYLFSRDSSGDYTSTMPLDVDEAIKEKVATLADDLRELDDVEDVYLGIEIEEE